MKKILAYKGFDENLMCRGFQYEVGKTYTHKGAVESCSGGFHACENPLDVFAYYAPASSKFALVQLSGKTDREKGGDTKVAAAKITIQAEISLPEIIGKGVDWIVSRAKEVDTNTGDYSAATNTGDYSAATNTGDYSAATNTGSQSAATNTGYLSAATNTGYLSAATNTGSQSVATNTGYLSAATNTGHLSAATNTGSYSAATNTGYQSAATNAGCYSAATNTGNRSAATNAGNQSAATNTGSRSAATNTGENAHALNTGYLGKAAAAIGCGIYLAEYNNDGDLIHNFAGIIGKNGLEPDTFYTLEDGEPKEVIQ
jgi:hypothetical protein